MPIYTLSGFQVSYDPSGNPFAVDPVSLNVVVPPDQTSFSYTVDRPATAEQLPHVTLNPDSAFGILTGPGLPGGSQPLVDDFAALGNIEVGTDTHTIVGLEGAGDNGATAGFIFQIGGDPLDCPSTQGDAQALESAITGWSEATGALAPGTDIPYSSLANTVQDSTANSIIAGSDADESLPGSRQDEYIFGFGGDDELLGRGGDDTISGGDGKDELRGGAGNDTINGGAGDEDRIRYDQDGGTLGVSVNLVTGVATDDFGDTDSPSGIERVTGSHQGDMLIGDAEDNDLVGKGGDDTISGRDGNEYIEGGAGNDTINGGAGDRDLVAYGGEDGAGSVTVDLGAGTATDTFGDADTLTNVENIRGTELGDTITGDANAKGWMGAAATTR